MNSVCIGYIGRHVTLLLGWCHCDVTMTSNLKMSYVNVIVCGNECYFYNKRFKIKRYARKRIKHECSVRIENSVPWDHWFALLGKASWCQTVTLGTEFSIRTSHPCKIPIISISWQKKMSITYRWNQNKMFCYHSNLDVAHHDYGHL